MITKIVTLGILADFYQGKFPKNDREKLTLLLWAIHILRNYEPPMSLDDRVCALVLESKKLKTFKG